MIDWRDRIAIIGAVLISTIVVLGFTAVCAALFFYEIPASSQRIADNLFGGLLVAFAGVVQYWTGSTSSSQKKDATIAQGVTTASATAAAAAATLAAKVP